MPAAAPFSDVLTLMTLKFGVPDSLMAQVTPVECTLNEDLLRPGLVTTLKVHSYFHNIPIKNLDLYKGVIMEALIERPVNGLYGAGVVLPVRQKVYRIGCIAAPGRPNKRKLINDNIEEFTIHACDPTLLNDAETLVSKQWKCTPPSPIVAEMLGCVAATATDVEGSCCPRDYTAENIHPFQVIAQQAMAALNGGDPDFVHYMTYENLGTHHFRSLKTLCAQAPIAEFFYQETGIAGQGYANPYILMNFGTMNYPCDFDLVSDILNGLGPTGIDLNSLISFNPFLRAFGMTGTMPLSGCAKGSAVLKAAMTNQGSEGFQLACPDYSPFYALKRQARMNLLEEDKIALNLTCPWNPDLHAGKVIRLTLLNKVEPGTLNYGSGDYLIKSMTHNIKWGGFSTTTLDCVSTTVGGGII